MRRQRRAHRRHAGRPAGDPRSLGQARLRVRGRVEDGEVVEVVDVVKVVKVIEVVEVLEVVRVLEVVETVYVVVVVEMD